MDRLAAFAAELVRHQVEVIVSIGGSVPALAAKHATRAIPIVFITGDPVGAGLVPSLSRPAGNLTGINVLTTELKAKGLDLLKEALPGVSSPTRGTWHTGRPGETWRSRPGRWACG